MSTIPIRPNMEPRPPTRQAVYDSAEFMKLCAEKEFRNRELFIQTVPDSHILVVEYVTGESVTVHRDARAYYIGETCLHIDEHEPEAQVIEKRTVIPLINIRCFRLQRKHITVAKEL